MQASHTGILTPDTAHAVWQCLDPPNSKSDSQLPAAAAGPYPSEGWKWSIGNEGDENSGSFRGSVHAEEEADKLQNKEGWRDSRIRHVRKSGADYTAAQYLEEEEQRTE